MFQTIRPLNAPICMLTPVLVATLLGMPFLAFGQTCHGEDNLFIKIHFCDSEVDAQKGVLLECANPTGLARDNFLLPVKDVLAVQVGGEVYLKDSLRRRLWEKDSEFFFHVNSLGSLAEEAEDRMAVQALQTRLAEIIEEELFGNKDGDHNVDALFRKVFGEGDDSTPTVLDSRNELEKLLLIHHVLYQKSETRNIAEPAGGTMKLVDELLNSTERDTKNDETLGPGEPSASELPPTPETSTEPVPAGD